MYNIWQTVLIFPIYILFTKRIKTFLFRYFRILEDIVSNILQAYFVVHLSQIRKEKNLTIHINF